MNSAPLAPADFEPMDRDEAEELNRNVAVWRQEFFEHLVKEFSFPDPAAVEAILAECEDIAFAVYDKRLGDTLNELYEPPRKGKLDGPLDDVIRLLEDGLNASRLYHEMAARGDDPASLARELIELPDRLKALREAAKAAHRKRAQRSGPLGELDLVAEKLARFYVEQTGKRFTKNHQNWASGKGYGWEERVLEEQPVGLGALFVFRVVRFLLGSNSAKKLKNALRDVKVEPITGFVPKSGETP